MGGKALRQIGHGDVLAGKREVAFLLLPLAIRLARPGAFLERDVAGRGQDEDRLGLVLVPDLELEPLGQQRLQHRSEVLGGDRRLPLGDDFEAIGIQPIGSAEDFLFRNGPCHGDQAQHGNAVKFQAVVMKIDTIVARPGGAHMDVGGGENSGRRARLCERAGQQGAEWDPDEKAHAMHTRSSGESYAIRPYFYMDSLTWSGCRVANPLNCRVLGQFFVAIYDKEVIKYFYEPNAPSQRQNSGSGATMLTKFIVAFSILALVAVFAGTVPGVAHVTLFKTAVISGTTLQAGEYRLLIGDNKVTFSIDKKTFDVSAKIEAAPKKFDNTEVLFDGGPNQNVVRQINLGGTKTQLIFN